MSTTRQNTELTQGSLGARARKRRPVRWWYAAAVGVLGIVLLGAGQPPPAAPPAGPSAPRPMAQTAPAAAPASPLDEPLKLIHAAQKAYQDVQDYTCVLIKRESINGVLPPQSIMEMKVRKQPFSVYLRWLPRSPEAGQEVCYVAGRNGGKIRVHPSGVLGAFGFLSLDANDPRVRKSSRRRIDEAGIGNTIERFARAWEDEKKHNLPVQVRVAEYKFDNRRCTRVETIQANNNGQFLYYRDVVYFDNQTHLPIRLEFYDWPRQQGDPGQLVEIYSFTNMRLNVGLTDATFNR